LLASESEVNAMRENYLRGGYGFGHAKQALFELILSKFEKQRMRFDELMANPAEIDAALQLGAEKARKVANDVLNRVRSKVGY
jgi:tryptophanyl-tRNA synthetase